MWVGAPLICRAVRNVAGGIMPYTTNDDLPAPIRRVLPEHAQDIFRAAFNHAWAAHGGSFAPDEATVHRIAWGAVKRRYRKLGGRWVERSAAERLIQGG